MAKLSELSIAQLSQLLDSGELADSQLTELKADSRQGARKLAIGAIRKKEAWAKEQARLVEMTEFERRLWKGGLDHVAGVDEVGAGPLAGPVVAAAVVVAVGVVVDGAVVTVFVIVAAAVVAVAAVVAFLVVAVTAIARQNGLLLLLVLL